MSHQQGANPPQMKPVALSGLPGDRAQVALVATIALLLTITLMSGSFPLGLRSGAAPTNSEQLLMLERLLLNEDTSVSNGRGAMRAEAERQLATTLQQHCITGASPLPLLY